MSLDPTRGGREQGDGSGVQFCAKPASWRLRAEAVAARGARCARSLERSCARRGGRVRSRAVRGHQPGHRHHPSHLPRHARSHHGAASGLGPGRASRLGPRCTASGWRRCLAAEQRERPSFAMGGERTREASGRACGARDRRRVRRQEGFGLERHDDAPLARADGRGATPATASPRPRARARGR